MLRAHHADQAISARPMYIYTLPEKRLFHRNKNCFLFLFPPSSLHVMYFPNLNWTDDSKRAINISILRQNSHGRIWEEAGVTEYFPAIIAMFVGMHNYDQVKAPPGDGLHVAGLLSQTILLIGRRSPSLRTRDIIDRPTWGGHRGLVVGVEKCGPTGQRFESALFRGTLTPPPE